MNRFAYLTTGWAVKTVSNLTKAMVRIHGRENIPDGSNIYVINHFTRIETFLMPYLLHQMMRLPVWSLASYELFDSPFGSYLDKIGAVSTKNPDRDRLMVKSLLTGEASWIVFPEGRMVKSGKTYERGRFIVSYAGGKHRPHTGAAALALRTEFYRQRLLRLHRKAPPECNRLLDMFQIKSIEEVTRRGVYIVPVNLTYYPIRARENLLSNLASRLVEDLPERLVEELMTEGTMLLAGVDIDIRFGKPIDVRKSLSLRKIRRDIESPRTINFDDPLPSRKTMRKEALKLMQRYMRAIYDLTTVNHDHLFAALLKRIPHRNIRPADLRNRVFLMASRYSHQAGVHLHQSLLDNQIHLITDDRYNKYRDFITIAEEKGIVRMAEGRLQKNLEKFRGNPDFHRVRIDNPVAVMANALEPVETIQKRIRHLAWLPAFRIRKMVADYLQTKAGREFETDYRSYFIPKESKDKNVGMPFLIKSRSTKLGVLIIHGYMAAPMEMRGVAEYLGEKGCLVYCPRLKGHGTAPEDLARRRYTDWMTSVDEGYALVRNLCKRVVVGGFSTGAGLALDLAHRVGDVRAVFAVCPPLKLQHLSSRLVPAVDVWNRIMRKVHLDGAMMDFVDNHPENPHINYLRNPVAGVRELERLMESVAPKLPDIKVPALIVQSFGDPVVDRSGAHRIYDLLGSEDKSYVVFNFQRHGILLGDGSEKVYASIWDFIRRFRMNP